MTKIFKITLLLFSGLIILSEVALRIFFYDKLKTNQYPLIYKPDSLLGYSYIPNSTGYISVPGIPAKEVHINSRGWPNEEFAVKKRFDVFRIAVVGSSTPAGIWMQGSTNYCQMLQKQFKENKYNVEVMNFSIDGVNRDKNNIDLIKKEVINYKPNLILLEFSFPIEYKHANRIIYKNYIIEYMINSEEYKKKGMEIIDYLDSHRYLTFFYDAFYLVRLMCKKYAEGEEISWERELVKTYRYKIVRSGPHYSKFREYSVKKSWDILTDINHFVNENRSKLVLMKYTSMGDNPIDKELLDSLNSKKLPYFFPNIKFNKTHHSLPDEHLNEKGHDLIASSLFKYLKKHIDHL